MSNKEVRVLARMVAKKGQEAALKAAAETLLTPTRAEEGCLAYDLFVDMERPDVFLMVETWASREALKKHSASPHLAAFGAKAAQLMDAPPDVRIFAEVER